MQEIIWVDLDEVLADLLNHILKFNDFKIWEYKLIFEEIKDYYIHKNQWIDIDVEYAIEWFRKPMLEDFNKYEISNIKWSKEKLQELKKSWYKLFVVTARIEEIFWEYTELWVDKYYSGIFDKIVYANHFHKNSKDKSELCLENNISYMVEDNYDYAYDLAKNGIKTFLLEKPWNSWQDKYHKNITRVKSWEDINL